MLAFTLLSSAAFGAIAQSDYQCLKANNQASYFNMNEGCSNTGTCVNYTWPTGDTYEDGTCDCCDPFDSTSFCYNVGWVFGAYGGTKCVEFTHYTYGLITFVLHIESYTPSSAPTWNGRANEIECRRGTDGYGVDVNKVYEELQAVPWEFPADAVTNPDLLPLVKALINTGSHYPELSAYTDYPGTIVPWTAAAHNEHCRTCLTDNSCSTCVGTVCETFGPEGAGGHMMIAYASDYNTFYNNSCIRFNGHIPTTALETVGCSLNQDNGQSANAAWDAATLGGSDGSTKLSQLFIEKAKEPTSTPVGSPTHPTNGFGWTTSVALEKLHLESTSFNPKLTGVLPLPTLSPTQAPTGYPTTTPVADPSCFGDGYTHPLDSVKFVGISEDKTRGCRHGLEVTWPGGNSANMCDSPYVLCLPGENTPNAGFPMNDGTTEPYLSNTALYTIDQCKRECAYDQRCMGFEFWVVTADATTGYCSLLDDVPIDIGTSANPAITTEGDLIGEDWNAFGGRLCFSKDIGTGVDQTCHPYFTADQLDDVMLKCYCPNNRKGFYTKKVTRTVAATKFCGADPGGVISDRIEEAQANRMFHLCENWCLFNTQTPRTESWYHDPWQLCWREQYSGIGMHRSYCYRVIRDPFTIEQYYIDQRAANMCPHGANSAYPTASPVDVADVTYHLAGETDSCDDVCVGESKRCAVDFTKSMTKSWADSNTGTAFDAFTAAGQVCYNGPAGMGNATGPIEGNFGWAFPGVDATGNCIFRNDENDAPTNVAGAPALENPCNLAIGTGYRRLCACTAAST